MSLKADKEKVAEMWKEKRESFDDYKWFGWADNDNNSHALKPDGETVCGVKITGFTELVYDPITACPECRAMIYLSKPKATTA